MTEAPPKSVSNYDKKEPVLFHYTNFFGLTGIVSSKSLWCSQIQYLNDSKELKEGFRVLTRICHDNRKVLELPDDFSGSFDRLASVNLHVCSFADASDILSQWRGYAEGSGVSISFSFESLQERANTFGFQLARCIYSEDEKMEVAEKFVAHYISILETAGAAPVDRAFDLASKFLAVAARFKHQSFAEECEWRLISPLISVSQNLIKVRATATGLVPYIGFDLKTGARPLYSDLQPWRTNEDICVRSVMVGPNREQEVQMNAVGKLFESHKAYVRGVDRSKIPFRSL